MQNIQNRMTIRFDSRSVNEGFARQAVAAFVAQLDPTLEELNDIKTAVSEAVTNGIVHGYANRLGYISIAVRLFEGGTVEIKIRDTGCGIENIAQAREPLFTTGDEMRSGMGFTIMESFMDKLRVRSTPGKGTSITMIKTLALRTGKA